MSTRGIYVVAFGAAARCSARRLLASIRQHMPDVPIAVCGAKRLGGEDVFIEQPDSDVGGRRAKLRAFELTPAEWRSVLYLDADTEIVAPVYSLFRWIEDGWEFVICRDVKETVHWFQRKNNLAEFAETRNALGTLYALQFNGGVWAFQRCEVVERFMGRWRREWEVHAQRDQGALLRALHADPIRVLVLGNEWNTFEKYTPDITTAGIMHYPGDARRWVGKIPGRLDARGAWQIVNRQRLATGRRP